MPEANFRDLPPIYAWRMLQREQDEQQAAQQADRKLGAVFNRMYPTQQPTQQMPPPGLPPPPGTPMGGPQAPPPGANMAPPQAPPPRADIAPPMGQGGGMPPPPPQTAGPPPGAMPPPPAVQPAPIPPFRPMPGAGPTSPAQGGIAPPPAAPAASEVVSPEVQNFLPKFIDAMRKENIPTEQWQMMLERLPPAIKDQMALQVKSTHEQNQALIGWANAQSRAQTADAATSRADTYSRNVDSLIADRKVGEGGIALTPGGLNVAKEFIKAGMPLPGGFGKAGISRGNKMLNELAKDEEGGAGSGTIVAGRSEYKAGADSLKQLTVRSNAIEQSSKKIDKDIATLNKFLESDTAGGVRLTNEPINAIRRKFSSPELAELSLAAQVVGTEYERMINGGLLSVAQLHEGAREDAKRLMNGDMTPEEIKRTLKVMLQEINNQKSAFKEQIAEVKGGLKTGAYSGDDAGKKRGEPSADSSAPTKINSDADYDKLPSGAEFIAPDGSHRRKP